MHRHESSVHPNSEFMQEVANKALTLEEARNGFPALWAHLQECEECFAAFTALLRLAHETGHQEGHSEESKIRRLVIVTAVVAIALVTLLASGAVLLRPRQPNEAAANRVYQKMSPTVANIQVKSAGVTGSGVVFDERGYILTNYHVIRDAQNDQDIGVQLPGINQVSSKLVGYDIATDLAVLQVDAAPGRLKVANFGDSERVQVGDLAIAIGNPFGLSRSLTVGHISAVSRRLMSNDMYAPDVAGVLQTDAAINPGNSGGPLFNSSGQVIGINTRIESPSGGSVGVGFAIPSSTALQAAQEIIVHGYVRRPFLGAGGRPIDAALAQELELPVDHGLLVQEIHPNSPAATAGLKTGNIQVQTIYGTVKKDADIILSVDGKPVRNQSDLNEWVARSERGSQIELDILRDGQRFTVKATVGERPRESLDGT